jgi:hypothetical protein
MSRFINPKKIWFFLKSLQTKMNCQFLSIHWHTKQEAITKNREILEWRMQVKI